LNRSKQTKNKEALKEAMGYSYQYPTKYWLQAPFKEKICSHV
jgi:hypothetical protein